MPPMRPKSAKGRARPTTSSEPPQASKASAPCDNCGGLQLVTWKGGGYNMTASRSSPSKSEASSTGRNLEDSYVSGLLQQIKLLELEINYMKQHTGSAQYSTSNIAKTEQQQHQNLEMKESVTFNTEKPSEKKMESNIMENNLKDQLKTMRKDLADKSQRLETVLSEKTQIANRLKLIEDRGHDGLDKQIETISKLTGRVEYLESEIKIAEDRHHSSLSQLETQVVLCKDREKQIHQLQEDVESKEERLETLNHQFENLKKNLIQKERQLTEIQDKFLQSSVHIMEETVGGLKEENKKLHLQFKDQEMLFESEKQLQISLKQMNDKLLTENAELSSSLTEMRQKLESEIRVRENRDAKLLLDTQEVVLSREREKELRTQISRLQNELERDRAKAKTLQDKLAKESQMVTSLELKSNTQKSRNAELEGSLEMAQENMTNIRKQSLLFQEKLGSLTKELDEKNVECQQLASKVGSAENKLYEAERRVEALATLQSHRWMEFSKMADNMKELSHNMLTQSKTNTRKAAIRADLDEELEM